uniref:Annexin-2 receptor n=2 Tax=Sus scrofa TaxID=9823 RepID=A0A8D1AZQ1_PIG
MEQTVPRCVREPWDSAEDSQEPEALQILSSGDPGGWRLPLYPSLGQLSWDDQDVSRELLSTPCGLLRPFCPKHGPRAQSACRPSAEPLAPHTPTTPGTRRFVHWKRHQIKHSSQPRWKRSNQVLPTSSKLLGSHFSAQKRPPLSKGPQV